MALIQQPHPTLYLPEYTDPIVCDNHLGGRSRPANLDVDLRSFRMINSVVEHLGEAVLPDPQYVVRQLTELRSDIPHPDDVFCQGCLERVRPVPAGQRSERVRTAAGLTGFGEGTI